MPATAWGDHVWGTYGGARGTTIPGRNVLRVDQETLSKDLGGKVYIVTGANSGIGLETTTQLVRQGGHVVMACRRPDAGEEAARSFAGKHDRLNGLACNAGIANMTGEFGRTKDGLELTTAISYFGHFLLTELLLDLLKQSAPWRIALVSSLVHAGSSGNRPRIHLDDLRYETRQPSNLAIYAEPRSPTSSTRRSSQSGWRARGRDRLHPPWLGSSNFGAGAGLGLRVLM